MGPSPRQLQHEFYSATAEAYDRDFVRADDEHALALRHISAFVDAFRYHSVLDVGTGTGRGVEHFLSTHDGVQVRGVEPVRA